MGREFRIRATGSRPPKGSCDEFLQGLTCGAQPLSANLVEPSTGGYQRRTYEYRAPGDRSGMPMAHVQLEEDGFYLCENGGRTELMDRLIRYALNGGAVLVEEL